MRRFGGWLLVVVACTSITTITTPIAPPASSVVTLIPSSTVTVNDTTTIPTAAISTVSTMPPEPPVTVTVAPPLITALTTTPSSTFPVTISPIPTSPPITIVPELPVVFSAPSEQLLIASTDLVRTSAGLPPLIPHLDLNFYARIWAGHLSNTGVLAHSDISTLLGPWLIVGENVGAGPNMGNIAAALAASPTHYETMVNPLFLYSGVGVAVDSAGRLWVVQVFGGTVLP